MRLEIVFCWRPALAFTLATFVGIAFLAGALLVFAADRANSRDAATARLQDAAVSAAGALRAGLAQRRREIEFLAAAVPTHGAEPLDREALRLFLRRAQELSPYYAMIGFIGADGKALVTSNGWAEGADVASRNYFLRGRIGPYVSDAHPAILLAKSLGAVDSAPRLIDVAAPVTDDGRLLGVLAAHVSAEWAHVIATHAARQSGARIEIRAVEGEPIASAGELPGGAAAPVESQSETVPGIGDGGAAHWTVVASAAPGTAARAGSFLAALALAGLAIFAAAGWALGRAITASIEAQTRNVMFLPAGRIPEWRDEPSPELCDLGAAVRLAAEEFAARDSAP